MRFSLIGCGGLIGLFIILGIIGALIGGGTDTANKPKPESKSKSSDNVSKATKKDTEAAKKQEQAKQVAEAEQAKKDAAKKAEEEAAKKAAAKKAAATHTLINFSGADIRNSPPFKVGDGPVSVSYNYDCSQFGSQGNFAADMISGDPSSLDSDDQIIANKLGNGGSDTTTLYPTNPGGDYHIEVNSECQWSIKVTGH